VFVNVHSFNHLLQEQQLCLALLGNVLILQSTSESFLLTILFSDSPNAAWNRQLFEGNWNAVAQLYSSSACPYFTCNTPLDASGCVCTGSRTLSSLQPSRTIQTDRTLAKPGDYLQMVEDSTVGDLHVKSGDLVVYLSAAAATDSFLYVRSLRDGSEGWIPWSKTSAKVPSAIPVPNANRSGAAAVPSPRVASHSRSPPRRRTRS
jgi:hypothetical protein